MVMNKSWVFRVVEGTRGGCASTKFSIEDLPAVSEGLGLNDDYAQGKWADNAGGRKCFDLTARGTEIELTISRALYDRVVSKQGFGLE